MVFSVTFVCGRKKYKVLCDQELVEQIKAELNDPEIVYIDLETISIKKSNIDIIRIVEKKN